MNETEYMKNANFRSASIMDFIPLYFRKLLFPYSIICLQSSEPGDINGVHLLWDRWQWSFPAASYEFCAPCLRYFTFWMCHYYFNLIDF